MPIYSYKCLQCNKTQDEYREVRDRNKKGKCNSCGMNNKRAFINRIQTTDYSKEHLSDAMGVPPGQVEEHRRMFPDIPMTDDGRVIVKSHMERKKFLKQLGLRDKDSYY